MPTIRGLTGIIPTYSHHAVVTGSTILACLFTVIVMVLLVRWWLRR